MHGSTKESSEVTSRWIEILLLIGRRVHMKQKARSVMGVSWYLVMVEGPEHGKFRPRMQQQKVGKHMSSNLKSLERYPESLSIGLENYLYTINRTGPGTWAFMTWPGCFCVAEHWAGFRPFLGYSYTAKLSTVKSWTSALELNCLYCSAVRTVPGVGLPYQSLTILKCLGCSMDQGRLPTGSSGAGTLVLTASDI